MSPPLAQGDLIRLEAQGPVVPVVRVTPCAAYVKIHRPRPHPDPERAAAGETIESGKVVPISPNACVWRVP